MSAAVGLLNLCVGVVYLSVGVITLIEMRRNWNRRGFSHFGAAWVVMLFTCGPHYFVHGEHMLFGGQRGGALDLVAVSLALPAGLVWFLLRLEAFGGGRGDRFIRGTPDGWPRCRSRAGCPRERWSFSSPPCRARASCAFPRSSPACSWW